jgi:hypothetical protein
LEHKAQNLALNLLLNVLFREIEAVKEILAKAEIAANKKIKRKARTKLGKEKC